MFKTFMHLEGKNEFNPDRWDPQELQLHIGKQESHLVWPGLLASDGSTVGHQQLVHRLLPPISAYMGYELFRLTPNYLHPFVLITQVSSLLAFKGLPLRVLLSLLIANHTDYVKGMSLSASMTGLRVTDPFIRQGSPLSRPTLYPFREPERHNKLLIGQKRQLTRWHVDIKRRYATTALASAPEPWRIWLSKRNCHSMFSPLQDVPHRLRRCDGTRPICRHCTRDKVECGGYSNARNPIRGVSNSGRPRPTLLISTIDDIDLASSGLFPARSYSGWTSTMSSTEPATPLEWTNINEFLSSPIHGMAQAGQLGLNPLLTNGPPRSASSTRIPQQTPTPPYHPTDIGPFDEVTGTFLGSKKGVRQSMTPGQASLFDALFSLAGPGDDMGLLESANLLDQNPLGPTQAGPCYNLRYDADYTAGHRDQTDPENSYDAQEIGAKLCEPLALDRQVKSNKLPFVLQSYALWTQHSIFEQVWILPHARKCIVEEYCEGPAARWRMMVVSHVFREITGSTEYTLKTLEVLEPYIFQELANFGKDRAADQVEALLAMSTTFEFIMMALKVFPLNKVVKSMQVVAPIFRRGCPDPEDRPVNLPNILCNINVNIKYFAMLDVLLSSAINRPMNFRYETTFPLGLYTTVFDPEQGPGPGWIYGVPDRLVIIFARMNALLEDFGPGVDPRVVKELDVEIKEVQAIVVASADPSLTVGRLVVQECWRQAAYIFLYMGLCGADSRDSRVMKAHGDFMEAFIRTKPGRIPDSFLVLPLPILGIATCHPDDQELLKRRMLALPECARKGTTGNQFIRMLECMWGFSNGSGQPTTWPDLRLASLYVAGV